MLRKSILILVIGVVVFPLLKFLHRLSIHDNHHTQHPGNCWRIKKMGTGSEDLQITSSGLAFITSGILLPTCPPDFAAFSKSKGRGRIEMFDMTAASNSESLEAKELKIKHGKDFDRSTFRPHGISVLEDDANGEHLIYVINHAENEDDRVEKFKYLPKTKELQHIKSFHNDLFRITNDLAVIAEDKFYIGNFVHSKNLLFATIAQVYDLPVCNVLFYDGINATSVIDHLVDPNGITLSKDGRFLYVNFPNAEVLRVYERQTDFKLRQVQEVTLHSLADNLHLARDGDSLYAGCHPNFGKIALHMMNPEIKSPSQVLRLPLKDGLVIEDKITQEFYDPGDLISASTVAGVFDNKMIVGSILDSLVLCQLPT